MKQVLEEDEDGSCSYTTTRTKPASSLEEIISNDLAVTVISETKSHKPQLPIKNHSYASYDDSAVHDMIIRSVSSVHSSWSQDGIVYKKQPLMRSHNYDKVSSMPSLDGSSSSISHNGEEQTVIKTINLTLYPKENKM